MEERVRTPTYVSGGLTDEETTKMRLCAAEWTANALRTGRTDRKALTEAILNLYRCSGLAEPRVVVVPSPYVMVLAAGIATAVWQRAGDKCGTVERNAINCVSENAIVKVRSASSSEVRTDTRVALSDYSALDAVFLATSGTVTSAATVDVIAATQRMKSDALNATADAVTWRVRGDVVYAAMTDVVEAVSHPIFRTLSAEVRQFDDLMKVRRISDVCDNVLDAHRIVRDAVVMASSTALRTQMNIECRNAVHDAAHPMMLATFRAISSVMAVATVGVSDAVQHTTADASDIAVDTGVRRMASNIRRVISDAIDRSTYDATHTAADAVTITATQDVVEQVVFTASVGMSNAVRAAIADMAAATHGIGHSVEHNVDDVVDHTKERTQAFRGVAVNSIVRMTSAVAESAVRAEAAAETTVASVRDVLEDAITDAISAVHNTQLMLHEAETATGLATDDYIIECVADVLHDTMTAVHRQVSSLVDTVVRSTSITSPLVDAGGSVEEHIASTVVDRLEAAVEVATDWVTEDAANDAVSAGFDDVRLAAAEGIHQVVQVIKAAVRGAAALDATPLQYDIDYVQQCTYAIFSDASPVGSTATTWYIDDEVDAMVEHIDTNLLSAYDYVEPILRAVNAAADSYAYNSQSVRDATDNVVEAVEHATLVASGSETLGAVMRESIERSPFTETTIDAVLNVDFVRVEDSVYNVRRNTERATRSATDNGTWFAGLDEHDFVLDEVYAATGDAVDDALVTEMQHIKSEDIGSMLLALCKEFNVEPHVVSTYCSDWYRYYQGGNMWPSDCAYLVAYRDILGLRLPEHENYAHWEAAAKLGGFRFMHEKFCMVCDFPDVLHVDERGRPHCDNGPSHRWSDGWSIWHIDGIVVDEQIVMRPETQTIEQIHEEVNSDARAIRIARYGWVRYLRDSNAKCIDFRDNEIEGTKEALYVAENDDRRLVATCATGRIFSMGVPSDISTCAAAQSWINRGIRVVART